MRIITIILPLLLLAGCDGHYRYPCQDPLNWGRAECNNEVCKAEGTCTSDVLAPAGTRELGLNNNLQSETTKSTSTEEVSTEGNENEISNTETVCAKSANLSYRNDEEERLFNVKHKEIVKEDEGNNSITREVITITDDAAEQPVTLKSEVDATAHDEATK